jgi:hypothetical protein
LCICPAGHPSTPPRTWKIVNKIYLATHCNNMGDLNLLRFGSKTVKRNTIGQYNIYIYIYIYGAEHYSRDP